MNVQIACPKCGRKRELALSEMSAGSAIACEGCGQLIRFKGADTAKVEQAIDELQAKLGGIVEGRRYTFQWSSLLILAYLAEGATRAWADSGMARTLALAEVVLSLVFFAAAVSYARLTRAGAWPPRRSAPR